VLYGKYDLLDRLRAYKVRPAPDDPRAGCPGGQVREGDAEPLPKVSGRRLDLKAGMTDPREYVHVLSAMVGL
jgi:hypothetical protein